MAPSARYLDVDAFERLVGEEDGKISVSELARRLVRIRQGQTASPKQEENARRQIQKWMDGKGLGALNVRRLSQALGADPATFLLPEQETSPEPIGLMREALHNQRDMKERWEQIDVRLEELSDGQALMLDAVTRILGLLEGGQQPGHASR